MFKRAARITRWRFIIFFCLGFPHEMLVSAVNQPSLNPSISSPFADHPRVPNGTWLAQSRTAKILCECVRTLRPDHRRSVFILELRLNQSPVRTEICQVRVCRAAFKASEVTTANSGTWDCVLIRKSTREVVGVSGNVTLEVVTEGFPSANDSSGSDTPSTVGKVMTKTRLLQNTTDYGRVAIGNYSNGTQAPSTGNNNLTGSTVLQNTGQNTGDDHSSASPRVTPVTGSLLLCFLMIIVVFAQNTD